MNILCSAPIPSGCGDNNASGPGTRARNAHALTPIPLHRDRARFPSIIAARKHTLWAIQSLPKPPLTRRANTTPTCWCLACPGHPSQWGGGRRAHNILMSRIAQLQHGCVRAAEGWLAAKTGHFINSLPATPLSLIFLSLQPVRQC